MSYLFGAGRPQPSSAEKLAAAETEVEMVSDMLNRCLPSPTHSPCPPPYPSLSTILFQTTLFLEDPS